MFSDGRGRRPFLGCEQPANLIGRQTPPNQATRYAGGVYSVGGAKTGPERGVLRSLPRVVLVASFDDGHTARNVGEKKERH